MRLPAKNSQSGRWGAEPTPVCPGHGYMTRQFIKGKKEDGKSTTFPTSWICKVCGAMKLDEERFEVVREKEMMSNAYT